MVVSLRGCCEPLLDAAATKRFPGFFGNLRARPVIQSAGARPIIGPGRRRRADIRHGRTAVRQGPRPHPGHRSVGHPESGLFVGHVGEEAVLLARCGEQFFAVGADCTHYHGPLAEGLRDGDTVRCPWHHACFSLRTGEALAAPAFNPLACWTVERRGDKIFVLARKKQGRGRPSPAARNGRRGSSSSAAAPPASPRPRCCAASSFRDSIVMLSDDDGAAGRPAEPVQGLPRRQRAGGLGPAAPGRASTRDNDIDLRLERERRRASTRARREVALGDGEQASPTTGCCWRPAPSRCGCRCRAPTCRTCTRCARSPTAAPSSRTAADGAARGRDRRELHRPRGRRLAARARASRCTSWRRRSGRWSACSGPRWATSCARLHEEHGVIFHLAGHRRRRSTRQACALKSGGTLAADLVVVGRRRAAARSSSPRRPASRSTAASSSTHISRPARPASSPPATSRAGPIAHSGDSDPRRALGGRRAPGPDGGAQHAGRAARRSPPCRSSGASTTTCRSTTSATPRPGTRSRSTATSRQGLPAAIQARRPRARRRLDLPRRRQPEAEAAMERAAA